MATVLTLSLFIWWVSGFNFDHRGPGEAEICSYVLCLTIVAGVGIITFPTDKS